MKVNKFEIKITLDDGRKSTAEIDQKDLCAVLGEAAHEAQNLGEVLTHFAIVGMVACDFSVIEAVRRCNKLKV